ncbi:hypothetical protein AWH63_11045 [Marinobacter sp. C18]|uniref:hypothetical protein n=1 Tax=Marinobacter sp. C18 TaxID=1772288 RepID=UPI0009490B85|nr:hypothetical protein [Marinobacter sp. C18]OLF82068.1 hypothetical protein AWH63_11045 [Marinobacter sp. C18]
MIPHHPFNDDLQSALDSDQAYALLPSGSWMEGGCTLLATALQQLIPNSQLYSVGRLGEGIPDHTVLCVDIEGEPYYIDYDGLHTGYEMRLKVNHEWNIKNPTMELADQTLLDSHGMTDYCRSAPALAKIISAQIGPIDSERLSPAWSEEHTETHAPS